MNDYVKLEIAREILNLMIGANGKTGYDKNNKPLMQLLADKDALTKNDMKIVDKIINVYGPLVKENKFVLWAISKSNKHIILFPQMFFIVQQTKYKGEFYYGRKFCERV